MANPQCYDIIEAVWKPRLPLGKMGPAVRIDVMRILTSIPVNCLTLDIAPPSREEFVSNFLARWPSRVRCVTSCLQRCQQGTYQCRTIPQIHV